jgi:hypothetical protein
MFAAGAYLTALKKLHPQIGELYGVDLAPNLVEIAQRWERLSHVCPACAHACVCAWGACRFAVPGDYCVADASDLSFVPSNSFDVVISNCVVSVALCSTRALAAATLVFAAVVHAACPLDTVLSSLALTCVFVVTCVRSTTFRR